MKETEMLEKLCQPIIEWLEKNHDPYTQVQITADRIELVQKVVGIPLKRTDERNEKMKEIDELIEKLAIHISEIIETEKINNEHEIAEKTTALAELIRARAATQETTRELGPIVTAE